VIYTIPHPAKNHTDTRTRWPTPTQHHHCRNATRTQPHTPSAGTSHTYATWLVDDGVPINMAQRVLGHERSSTTLDLYTRKTSNHDRIRDALDGGYTGSTGSS
jgi:integrase